MKYFFSFILALIVVLLIVNFVSEGVKPDGAAVSTLVEGTVRIFTTESPAGRLIKKDDSIAKNDRVEVQGNSRLELRLPDGNCLRLSDNARLTIRMLQFERRTGTLYLQAFLDNGRLWAKMKKRATPDSWADVITRTGTVAGKGTVFSVNAEEGSSTTVNVYDGTVLVKSTAKNAGQTAGPAEGQPVNVQTLQQVIVSAREGGLQPQGFDLKTAINDWIRWNLQRDAREGLASITIAPASAAVTTGKSLQFAAVAHYPDNAEKDITSFATWSSSDAKIAKIDPSGMSAGTSLGAATISAAIEDITGSTVLNVTRDVVAIKVTPASSTIANGSAQQFTAIGTFSDKTTGNITSSVVWKSSNTNVAFVDAAGRTVGGNQSGSAVISASFGTRRASATIKVRRELISIKIMPESAMIMVNETQRFGAIGSYSDKTTEDLTETVDWETSDPTIAEIDQAIAGRVIGKNKAANATIRASYKGKSGTGTITIYTLPSP